VLVVVAREGISYEPLTIAALGQSITRGDDSYRWRLVAEFLEEHRWEPVSDRLGLLRGEPVPTGDDQWDVFLAALAEHLAARDGRGAPRWTEARCLRRFWFPFTTRAARVGAIQHAPAAFRRRGIFVAPQEFEVA
jgi:hypothetical protein